MHLNFLSVLRAASGGIIGHRAPESGKGRASYLSQLGPKSLHRKFHWSVVESFLWVGIPLHSKPLSHSLAIHSSGRSSFLVISRLWLKQIMSFICIFAYPTKGWNWKRDLHEFTIAIYISPTRAPFAKGVAECINHQSKYTHTHTLTNQGQLYNGAYCWFEFEIPSPSGSKMENADVILMKTAVDAAVDSLQTINSVCHRRRGN